MMLGVDLLVYGDVENTWTTEIGIKSVDEMDVFDALPECLSISEYPFLRTTVSLLEDYSIPS